MNLFKYFLIVLIIFLVVAQPALKDKLSVAKISENIDLIKGVNNSSLPKDTQAQSESYNPQETHNNPDDIDFPKAVNNFLAAKNTQAQAERYTAEKIQNKNNEIELQKYTSGTEINWGQCRNETGKTLAVYGSKPDFDDDDRYYLDDDDRYYSYDNTLYFLAAGQTTKNKWDCDGVYLPNDVRATNLSPNGQGKELGSSVAVKIADGTNLVVKTNPETAAVELNVHPPKVFKAGEVNWFIPNVSQAVIDARVPNAPAITKYSHSSRNFKL